MNVVTLLTQGGCGLVGLALIARREDDGASVHGERLSGGESQSAVGTGDECDGPVFPIW